MARNSLLLFLNMGTKPTYYAPSCATGGSFQTAVSEESPQSLTAEEARSQGGNVELMLRSRQMSMNSGRSGSGSLKEY